MLCEGMILCKEHATRGDAAGQGNNAVPGDDAVRMDDAVPGDDATQRACYARG